MKKFDFKKIATKAAGAAAGGTASALVKDKLLPDMNPKMRAALQIVAGAVLPELSPKSDFLNAVGMGMIGVGAADLAKETNLISGVGNNSDIELPETDTVYVTDTDYEIVDTDNTGIEGFNDGIGTGGDNPYA